MAAELDQAGLVRMQRQRELPQPFAHRIPETPGVGLVLETDYGVIGIAHDDHVARGLAPSPACGPEIEDVVEVDVRERRRNHRALSRPCFLDRHDPVFEDAGSQPFWTSRMMRLSPIRCSRKRTTHSWETSVKNDRMSASRMKFTFLLLIPTISASSASCWLRPGRNPYENPRKSAS